MNINKYIAQSGLASRRGADELIKAGKVRINNEIAKPIDKVTENDKVFVEGKLILKQEEMAYLAFNKPVGVITTSDPQAKDNIINFIKYPVRIFPIGRLDVNSQGLILLTNDGEVVNKILKGKNKVEKEYLVNVDRTLNDTHLVRWANGVTLDGYKTLPAKVEKINERQFKIVIHEGKNRQIRRMAQIFRYNVTKLVRVRIGKIELGDLKPGKYIELSKSEFYSKLGINE